jgi:uncharacterized membrane protein YfcA
MPNRRTHELVGTTTGIVCAAYRARNQNPRNQFLETVGGAVGGYLGSTFADYLEPAISSWHRGAAHSAGTGAMVLFSVDHLAKWEAFCRKKAEQYAAIPMVPVVNPQGIAFVPAQLSPLAQLLRTVAELFWRFLAGFPAGFATSYLSHLALDAATPRSIPLLR